MKHIYTIKLVTPLGFKMRDFCELIEKSINKGYSFNEGEEKVTKLELMSSSDPKEFCFEIE